MTTIDDIIAELRKIAYLLSARVISYEDAIKRLDNISGKLEIIKGMVYADASQHLQTVRKLCITDLTRELPSEVKEKRK